MKIIDILEENKILLNYHFISKKRLFEKIAEMISDEGEYGLNIYHGLMEREKLGNTSLGNGVAVPHGKCLADKEIKACLIRMAQPIDYEAIDDVPVSIVVAIAFPVKTTAADKALMKDTANLFKQHRLYRKMMSVETKEEILAGILEEFQLCSN